MEMTSEDLASMTAEIVMGWPKSGSRFVKTPEDAALWDKIQADIDKITAQYPEAVFDIPNEMP